MMESELNKCVVGVLVLKGGKLVKIDSITLPGGQAISINTKINRPRWLQIFGDSGIRQSTKSQCKKEYERRLKMALKSK